MDAFGRDAGESFHVGDHGPESVAIERVAVQRLGVEHELAAPRGGDRRCHAHFASELVGRARLAFADAFDLRRVQRIYLLAALAVILQPDFDREIEEVGEALLEGGIALGLAPDVADDAAEPGAQELQLPPHPLELMGMGIAPNHDGGAFGDAPIALP